MNVRAVRTVWPYAFVAVLAFAVREILVLRGGGLRATYGYDTGVYYASADAFLHGRLPYRDFVLLHPPAIMLALTPAALIGHLTSDQFGFESANTLFTALGAANAALVAVAARRWGLGRGAALAGGLFYATWFSAVAAEFGARLEPLGNFFLLGGLALLGPPDAPGKRRTVAAGAALALAVSTKIWFGAPALVIGLWLLARRRFPDAARYGAGLAGAALLVDGPFLVLSHGVMFSRVVLDQLGRGRSRSATVRRWSWVSSVARLPHGALTAAFLIAAAVLVAVVLAGAAARSGRRLFPVLAVVHLLVLLAAPSFFSFYADFAAAPLALSVAVVAGDRYRVGRLAGYLATAAAASVTTTVLAFGHLQSTTPWRHVAALQSAARPYRCVMSDAPAGLIELDKLDSDLAHGCPNWVDVTGRTYFPPDRQAGLRSHNLRWQHDLVDYLRSGDAVFIVRAAGDGLTARSQQELAGTGLLARSGTDLLYGPPRHTSPRASG